MLLSSAPNGQRSFCVRGLLSLLAAAFLLYACTSPDSPSSTGGTTKPKAWHVTTFAGNGGSGNQDGTGAAASFGSPFSITKSGTTLYVLQSITRRPIRTVNINNAEVKTIVNGGTLFGSTDGNGTAALFNNAFGISAGAGSTLYVADSLNHLIRKVTAGAAAATTQVETFAGAAGTAGKVDAVGTAARFNRPSGITVSGSTLYVTDAGSHSIRAIDTNTKRVETIAGTGSAGTTDGAGNAAQFNSPFGIAADGTKLYIADRNNHRIRAITIASKAVRTLAGSTKGHADGVGTAAKFDTPMGVALDGRTLYVADRKNHRIRAIDTASGKVTTIAGSGTKGRNEGKGTAAQFDEPVGIVADGTTLYVVSPINNNIRKLEYKEVK